MAERVRPKRIQRQRTKGWRMPANTVYVGRPTRFGNPFQVALGVVIPAYGERMWDVIHGSTVLVRWDTKKLAAADAVDRYRRLRREQPLTPQEIASLRGKHLACFCPLDQPCHADVLLELANVC
jgi:hypothetical protein